MFNVNDQLWSSCKTTACAQARQVISSRKFVGSVGRISSLAKQLVQNSIAMKKIPQRLDVGHLCRSEKKHVTPRRTAMAEGPRGILLFGFSKTEEESISNWLSEANIKVASGKVSSNPRLQMPLTCFMILGKKMKCKVNP
jgi:hypothetical protein